MVQDINAPYVPLTPEQRLKKLQKDEEQRKLEKEMHEQAAYNNQMRQMRDPNRASRRNGRI